MCRRGSGENSFVDVVDTNVNYQTCRCEFIEKIMDDKLVGKL